ncbi:MAG: cytochrome C [Deltaproteobacteria bacterium]|nr:cytochrome C [Deltaproteobacteria bacterium]
MEKRKFLWVSGILGMLFLVLALGINAQGTSEQSGHVGEQRSDIIVIDTSPEVVFLHDLHTDALEKLDKDCTTCHLPEKPGSDRISPKFKQLKDIKDVSKKQVEDIYRTECLGCHEELTAAGQKAGPVEWQDCYKDKVGAICLIAPWGFDKSLHFRHTKATTAPCQKYQWGKEKPTNKGDCGLCHHEYDETAKKIFYEKGKEGSCRYCHMKETEENRISMRLASHYGCIECHQKTLAENKKAGPYRCSGCHDLKEQQKIKKLEVVPRIERNQPDIVLIATNEPEKDKEAPAARMNPVPFDHKAHEIDNDSCIVCHHASLDSCSKKCHTPPGSKEGEFITLERAMHLKGCEDSCVGCHETNQSEPKCAACHSFMEKGRKEEASCLICHMEPGKEMTEVTALYNENVMAEMLLQSRKTITSLYKDEDIPEKVIIKRLEDKYEPVEMPHRKMVKTLFDNIKDNKLAGSFHPEIGTVCQGCHHNSPPSKKHPGCGSCHGKQVFDGRNTIKPEIRAAYHQKCIGCHNKLGLEKPKTAGCIDCHKEKEKVAKAN